MGWDENEVENKGRVIFAGWWENSSQLKSCHKFV